ncbi:hypothetical protein NW94_24560 [Burkholderia mallei]|uniref:Uncharacterized protein n=1 Tax=Burkholderia mallei (strain NCTC 10229) TaxID=412022 RepID=A2S0E4_BURM9|nr:hypothetical protein BMASAVP1_1419 [Burkholderia mallei SAVP1]ABN00564.2 hypothetical protein BMA10229_1613 [Burkholderia mallei NCTC 10229]AIW49314.1 hypothetical protein DM57_14205 [Burkholderia mallei]AYX33407.1 hypothetical protein EGY16_22745 [Burkholderia pseudomallei]EDS83285.1 hypothetical protein BURPSS13_X0661 [Burkholderia pseudomallei S13]
MASAWLADARCRRAWRAGAARASSGFIVVHRGQCRFDPRRATMPFGVAGAFDASRPRRIRRDAGSGIAAP